MHLYSRCHVCCACLRCVFMLEYVSAVVFIRPLVEAQQYQQPALVPCGEHNEWPLYSGYGEAGNWESTISQTEFPSSGDLELEHGLTSSRKSRQLAVGSR